ncbi:ATP-binding protein [Chromatiaceae bacterium AAb-1]|nr:ATP-binding protein [Chromatiaceae bacterium AAb-1]
MHFRALFRLNSIGFKVLLAFLVGVVLSISLIVLVVSVMLFSRSNMLSESDISDYTRILAEGLLFDGNAMPVAIRSDHENYMPWLFDSIKQEVAYRVLDEAGQVVLSSAAGPVFWPDGISSLQPGSFEFERDGVMLDGATRLVEHNGQRWFLQAAASRRFMNFAHRAFALRFVRDSITVFSWVLLFVFGICAHITLKHTLRPLREVSESASAISPRSLQARLQNHNVPFEIAPLVNSFNQALERLEHGYRVQQEFLTTAAHELKTPLALIRAQLELMEETEDRNWLLHDVEYMSRQVQQLLLLAEASEQQNYKFVTVDVPQIVTEAVTYLQRMAETAGVKLELVAGVASINWQADKGALFTLLKNLLENAIQHAPPDSEVQIEIQQDRITVRDYGVGVAEAQLSLLFNRFWRGEHRRDLGAGLGLAICQEIALAHGWSLSASRAEPGLIFQLSRAPLIQEKTAAGE